MLEETTPVPATQNKKKYNFLSVVGLLLLSLWIGVSRIFALSNPPVGLYIGVLAFMAAIVTLWPPDNAWAKAGWLVVFGWFLVLEVNTLYNQRAEDAETARKTRIAEDNRFAGLLKVQQDSFAAVLQKSQEEFEATIRESNSIFKKTVEAASFASGGDSFPAVFPYPAGDGKIGFGLAKQGRYPLYKLIVSVGRAYQTSPASMNVVGTTFRQTNLTMQINRCCSRHLRKRMWLSTPHPCGPETVSGKK